MTDDGSGRTLKTARAVLRVLKMMARAAPDGLRPDQVAEMLNKSTATGTYLLNSLCREGFAERTAGDGLYRLTEPMAPPDPQRGLPTEDLGIAVEELYARTNERDALEHELADVRARRFATDREEYAEGFCCIAAPIFDRSGGLRGSLALSTTRARFDEDRERLIPIVMAVARAASHRGRSPSWEHLDPPHARHRTALQAVH